MTVRVGSLYPPPPIRYRDVTAITVVYATEFHAVRSLTPAVFEVPETPTVNLTIRDVARSSLGSFREVQLSVDVKFEGESLRYFPFMYVSTDAALTMGREALGVPKRLARIELTGEPEGWVGTLERPRGLRLVTCMVAPRELVPDPIASQRPGVYLRVQPAQGRAGDAPTFEILRSAATYETLERWDGLPALSIETTSHLDPLYLLAPQRLQHGMYVRANLDADAPLRLGIWKPDGPDQLNLTSMSSTLAWLAPPPEEDKP